MSGAAIYGVYQSPVSPLDFRIGGGIYSIKVPGYGNSNLMEVIHAGSL
jgi:hypothetical protein